MTGPSLRRLLRYVQGRLRLRRYLTEPGDGRLAPRISAFSLLWALLFGEILHKVSFNGIEALVRSRARLSLGISRRFGDDASAYFTERLSPEPILKAAVSALRRAKRNKAFAGSPRIGLGVDGTGAGRSRKAGCSLCRPRRDPDGEIRLAHHHASLISVVGTGLSLPFDVEPWGPGDSEYRASQRLMRRVVKGLGPRFADYLVGDGEYATSPFLHLANELGLRVVAHLKSNLPELFQTATRRFADRPADQTFRERGSRVELWDADDFDPWETLRWRTVRVLRYRQHKPDGTVSEAYWLTDFSCGRLGSRALYRIAKSRG